MRKEKPEVRFESWNKKFRLPVDKILAELKDREKDLEKDNG